MKEQIEQILNMATSGKLTGPQAAELIAELTARAAPEPTRPPKAAKTGFWSRLGIPTSHTVGVFASDLKDNDLSMSSVDLDQGESQVFRDNTLSMSSISRFSLVRSEMTGNTVRMSSLEDVALEDARFTGCELQKSSVESLALRGGTLRGLTLTASHMKGLVLEEGAVWEASEITGSQINDALLQASTLDDVDIQGAQLAGLELVRARLRGCILQGTRLKKVGFVDTELSDVLISGGDTWKRSGFEEVRFEHCKLHRAIFSECRFVRTTLRNIDASELKVHRVELVDRVIDGTEAFLAAISNH